MLTEGRSDSRILARSLKLLIPEFAHYFTFMDFEGARVAGGAEASIGIVKAFAGAGISNRIVAIFDNDTAAAAALKQLRYVDLPANMVAVRMPEIEFLRDYPTIGPTGADENGRQRRIAGSIQLYLGRDLLADDSGECLPIQWFRLRIFNREIPRRATQ